MAQRLKAKSKSKGPKNTDKKQSERFKETARAIGADESGSEFDKALRRIMPRRSARTK